MPEIFDGLVKYGSTYFVTLEIEKIRLIICLMIFSTFLISPSM